MSARSRFALVEVTESRTTDPNYTSLWYSLGRPAGVTNSVNAHTYLLGIGGVVNGWDPTSPASNGKVGLMRQMPVTSSNFAFRWDPWYPTSAENSSYPSNLQTFGTTTQRLDQEWGVVDVAAVPSPVSGSERVLIAGGLNSYWGPTTATWWFDPNDISVSSGSHMIYAGPPMHESRRTGVMMCSFWTTSAGVRYPSYIVAGGNSNGTAEVFVEVPTGPQAWQLINTLQFRHNRGAMVVYPDQSRLLLVGGDLSGAWAETIPLQNVNVYGPSIMAGGPSARYNFASGMDMTGRFWVIGGIMATTGQPTNQTWYFDFSSATGSWRAGPDLPVACSEGQFISSKLAGSDQILVIGGHDASNNALQGYSLRYMDVSPTWQDLAIPMWRPRYGGHKAKLIGENGSFNGYVFVYGGDTLRSDTGERIPDFLAMEEATFKSMNPPPAPILTSYYPTVYSYTTSSDFDVLTVGYTAGSGTSLSLLSYVAISGVSGSTGYDPPWNPIISGGYNTTSGSQLGMTIGKNSTGDYFRVYFPHGGLRNYPSIGLNSISSSQVTIWTAWSPIPPEFRSISPLSGNSNTITVPGNTNVTLSGYWLDSVSQVYMYKSGASTPVRWYCDPLSGTYYSHAGYDRFIHTPKVSDYREYTANGTWTRWWLPQNGLMNILSTQYTAGNLVEKDVAVGPMAVDTSQLTGTGVVIPPQYVLQTERWADAGHMAYTFYGMPIGSFVTATLYFVENHFWIPGQRNFSVVINGATVLSNFDIYAQAGGALKAIARTFTTTAVPGTPPDPAGHVTIQFNAGTSNYPKVNAISIKDLYGNVTYVNCGGSGSGIWGTNPESYYLTPSPTGSAANFSTPRKLIWLTPNSGSIKPHYDSDNFGVSPNGPNWESTIASFPLDEAPNATGTREAMYGYVAPRSNILITTSAIAKWGGLGGNHYCAIPDFKGDGNTTTRHGFLSAWPLSYWGGTPTNSFLRSSIASGFGNTVVCFWYRVASTVGGHAFATLGNTWNASQANYCGYLLTIGGGQAGPAQGFDMPYVAGDRYYRPAINYVGSPYVGTHYYAQNLLMQIGWYQNDYPFIAWQNGYRYQTSALLGTNYYPDFFWATMDGKLGQQAQPMPRVIGKWYQVEINFNTYMKNPTAPNPIIMRIRGDGDANITTYNLWTQLYHHDHSTGPGQMGYYWPDMCFYGTSGVDRTQIPPGGSGYISIGPLPNVYISDLVIHDSDPNDDHDHFQRNYDRAQGLSF